MIRKVSDREAVQRLLKEALSRFVWRSEPVAALGESYLAAGGPRPQEIRRAVVAANLAVRYSLAESADEILAPLVPRGYDVAALTEGSEQYYARAIDALQEEIPRVRAVLQAEALEAQMEGASRERARKLQRQARRLRTDAWLLGDEGDLEAMDAESLTYLTRSETLLRQMAERPPTSSRSRRIAERAKKRVTRGDYDAAPRPERATVEPPPSPVAPLAAPDQDPDPPAAPEPEIANAAWTEKIGRRGRHAWCLIIGPGDKAWPFDGRTIPDVVTVLDTASEGGGRWRTTTYKLRLSPGTRLVSGIEGWDTGTILEALSTRTGEPIQRWHELASVLGLSVSATQDLWRGWRPTEAAHLDEIEASLSSLDAIEEEGAEEIIVSFGGPTRRERAAGFWDWPVVVEDRGGTAIAYVAPDARGQYVSSSERVRVLETSRSPGYGGGSMALRLVVPAGCWAQHRQP